MEQTVRLGEDGVELDLFIAMTPRALAESDRDPADYVLDYQIRVQSRKRSWWEFRESAGERALLFESEGVLYGLSGADEHRFVFKAHGRAFMLSVSSLVGSRWSAKATAGRTGSGKA